VAADTLTRPVTPRAALPPRRGPATMGRVVIALAIGLLLAVGFEVLEERWETQEDVLVPGSRSELVVDVRVARGPVDTAASALVGACAWVVPDHAVTLVGPTGERDGRYAVTVEPALEHHGRRKFVGCLEDGTIDRVWGDVRAIERIEPS
jgi:hypothetical protein